MFIKNGEEVYCNRGLNFDNVMGIFFDEVGFETSIKFNYFRVRSCCRISIIICVGQFWTLMTG